LAHIGKPAGSEKHAGKDQQQPGQAEGRADHSLSADGVEKAAEQQRAQKISDCQRQDVEADALGRDTVEARQHKAIGKENSVVKECLRHHQRKSERRSRAVFCEHGLGDQTESEGFAWVNCERLAGFTQRMLVSFFSHGVFDAADHLLRGLFIPVGDEPARALRHVAAKDQNG
jgi:hypothetical protein